MTAQFLAQSWNNIVTTTINEPNCERIDMFTNKNGNHIVIQNSGSTNSIKYYLLNSSGIVIRTSVIESSGGAQFPKVSGSNDKIYIVYKLGSELKVKKSTDAGLNWSTNISSILIGNNTCNGIDIDFDFSGLHLVYATQDDFPNFETYYYRLNSSDNWVDFKNITDGTEEENEYGGMPRITVANNKAYVVYSNTGSSWENNNYCLITGREKNLTNNFWEDALIAFQASPNYSVENMDVVIRYDEEILFFYLCGSIPPDPPIQEWVWRTRKLEKKEWSAYCYLPPEENQLMTFSLALNSDKNLFTFYSVLSEGSTVLYKTILNNSVYTIESEIKPLILQLKSTSVSNDVFLIWRNEGSDFISYQHYDANPLAPQNFNVSTQGNYAQLSWTANTEPDMRYSGYYKVYRASTAGGVPSTWTYVASVDAFNGTIPVTSWIDPDPWVGSGSLKLYYRLTAVDNNSHESNQSNYDWVSWDGSFQKQGQLDNTITEFKLNENFPNPFNPSTRISYQLPTKCYVTLKVYNVLGGLVSELVNEVKEEGKYYVNFNAADLPSGIYIYTMQATSNSSIIFSQTKNMILIK